MLTSVSLLSVKHGSHLNRAGSSVYGVSSKLVWSGLSDDHVVGKNGLALIERKVFVCMLVVGKRIHCFLWCESRMSVFICIGIDDQSNLRSCSGPFSSFSASRARCWSPWGWPSRLRQYRRWKQAASPRQWSALWCCCSGFHVWSHPETPYLRAQGKTGNINVMPGGQPLKWL